MYCKTFETLIKTISMICRYPIWQFQPVASNPNVKCLHLSSHYQITIR